MLPLPRSVWITVLSLISPVAWAEKPSPVVVELFSSEGCSSCPPADLLLKHLDDAGSGFRVPVIALEFHVDYWNRLGWTDPFSSALFSERQSEYAHALGNDRIYTPQMVADGVFEFVGGDPKRAELAVDVASHRSKVPLEVSLKDNQLRIDLEAVPQTPAAEVWLAVVERDLSTHVLGGENSGKTLQHGPVVQTFLNLGKVAPVSSVISTRLEPFKNSRQHAIVLVQQVESRKIIAAATVGLKEAACRQCPVQDTSRH